MDLELIPRVSLLSPRSSSMGDPVAGGVEDCPSSSGLSVASAGESQEPERRVRRFERDEKVVLWLWERGLETVLGLMGSSETGPPEEAPACLRFRPVAMSPNFGFVTFNTLPARTSSSAMRWRGHKWPYRELSSTESMKEHSMKMARRDPLTTLGAAISHTFSLRGSRATLSGSISPKTMISFPE